MLSDSFDLRFSYTQNGGNLDVEQAVMGAGVSSEDRYALGLELEDSWLRSRSRYAVLEMKNEWLLT